MRKKEKVSHVFRFAKALLGKNQNQLSKRNSNYIHLFCALVVASTDVLSVVGSGAKKGVLGERS